MYVYIYRKLVKFYLGNTGNWVFVSAGHSVYFGFCQKLIQMNNYDI